MDFPDIAIPEAFAAAAAGHPDAPAAITDAGTTTFAELAERSARVAAHLAGRGIGKGDRVALLAPNAPEFAEAYLGIVRAGAVVVPVNLMLNPKEMAWILNDAGVRALVYHPALAEAVAAFRGAVESLESALSLGEAAAKGDTGWAAVQAEAGPVPEVALSPETDLAAILYTSGTTGHPKGAMLSHRNLVANTHSIRAAVRLRPGEDRLLVVLPMFHAFAATVGMLTPLLHGLAFVPVPRFEPEMVVGAIERHGATIFLGVPSMYSLLLRLPEGAEPRLASLRLCVSGGAAMPVEVMQRFEGRFGLPVYEGDGPTECAPVTCLNPLDGERKPGSVGLPVPGVAMRIADDDGADLPDNEVGEICVRGPNVMRGYWHLPEATAEVFFGDWFRTGDVGFRDDDGYFHMVDRKKDLIIVNGMNVYPRVVEEALHRQPAVAEVAVVGEPHELHGEIPVAYVALREGEEADSAALRRHCQGELGRHEVPRKFFFLGELPKNATGKILKRALRNGGELERGVDSRQEGE